MTSVKCSAHSCPHHHRAWNMYNIPRENMIDFQLFIKYSLCMKVSSTHVDLWFPRRVNRMLALYYFVFYLRFKLPYLNDMRTSPFCTKLTNQSWWCAGILILIPIWHLLLYNPHHARHLKQIWCFWQKNWNNYWKKHTIMRIRFWLSTRELPGKNVFSYTIG